MKVMYNDILSSPMSNMDDKRLNGHIEEDYPRLESKAYCLIGSEWPLFGDTVRDAIRTLINEAYLKAAQKFEQFDPERASFVTWYGCFIQQAIRRKKRSADQELLVQDYPMEGDTLTSYPSFDDLDHDLIRHETVDGFTSRLDGFDRILLYLYYGLGLHCPEIAKMLHCPSARIYSRLQCILRYCRSIAPGMTQNEQRNSKSLSQGSLRRKSRYRPIRRRVAANGQ